MPMFNSTNPVDTEIEILKSRTNAEEVVKRLHLDWGISEQSKGLTFRIAEFASTSKAPDYTIVLTGPDKTTVANADGSVTVGMPTFVVKNADGSIAAQGKTGERVRTPSLTLRLDEIQGKRGDRFRLRQRPFNGSVQGVMGSTRVSQVGKFTNVIKVTCSDTNPVMASAMVNTLVQAYLEQTLSFRTEEAGNTVKFVEDQLKGTREELDRSEQNLQTYKSTSGMVKLDAEAEELVRKLSEVEKERASVTLQRNQVEFALEALKKARRKGGVYSPAAFKDDPLIGTMAAKLTELEMQRRALVAENTERHPQVKAVQGQIDQLQGKIQSTFETARLNLTKQEASIKQQIAEYEAKLGKLPEAERTQARLMRHSKVNADIYTFLLQKHEEARIARASTISNINIVDPAIVPESPVKPQKNRSLLLGLLVGLMFGAGAAFFTDYLDDTIKDEEEAKRALGWPLLAMIPTIEGAAKEVGTRGPGGADEPEIVVGRGVPGPAHRRPLLIAEARLQGGHDHQQLPGGRENDDRRQPGPDLRPVGQAGPAGRLRPAPAGPAQDLRAFPEPRRDRGAGRGCIAGQGAARDRHRQHRPAVRRHHPPEPGRTAQLRQHARPAGPASRQL